MKISIPHTRLIKVLYGVVRDIIKYFNTTLVLDKVLIQVQTLLVSDIYDDHVRNSPAFSKDDNRRLQIIVNKVLRCITGLDRETSTRELHEKSGQLSVHQRCAFFTMVLVHKTLITRKPEYHLDRLSSSMPDDMQTRRTGGLRMEYKLSISRCSFFYRGCKLYNLLPSDLKKIDKMASFKKAVKDWTKKNIAIIPP